MNETKAYCYRFVWKHKDGRVVRVFYIPSRKQFCISGRKPHKKTKQIFFSEEAASVVLGCLYNMFKERVELKDINISDWTNISTKGKKNG